MSEEEIQKNEEAKQIPEINMIPQKVAAIEMYKITNKKKLNSILAIVLIVLTAVVSYYSRWGGALVAGLATIGMTYAVISDKRYTDYLNKKYSITK